ncbi:MAG: NADP-dependent isocitrate dehydrogenase [Tannerellaceae bacterium]|jgi:isocitrate dehydrogenase|nr:NADP-dependent isocitrate dehydrogenase [Tannerellaceae bacterium]
MKARKVDGRLVAPDIITVPFIEGDGVGSEITPVALSIVSEAVKRAYLGARTIEWKEALAGEKAFNTMGSHLPAETMDVLRSHLIGLKGPLATPVGEGIRSLNVAIRQDLDLYACIRPVKWFKGVVSPIREPWKVDMVIFRENTEDIYSGIEWEEGTPEAAMFMRFLDEEMGVTKVRFPLTSSFGVKPVSVEGSERLVRAAIRYGLSNGRKSVTLVHKGNIMKYTEGGFRRWGYELAGREFGDEIRSGRLVMDDVITDAFLQSSILHPERYSLIATLNLNGDYISDQLAALVGGIGIAPGANINCDTGHAIFEATHGTAPNIAGKNTANPSSLILSSAMMLDYIGWERAAALIRSAVESAFELGEATGDLARLMTNGKVMGTKEFGECIIKKIGML